MTRYFLEGSMRFAGVENPDYWSSDCQADRPLDQTPGDGIWP